MNTFAIERVTIGKIPDIHKHESLIYVIFLGKSYVCDSSKPADVQIGKLCAASSEQVYDASSEQVYDASSEWLCTFQQFTKYYTEN